jgi:hypothetical protein
MNEETAIKTTSCKMKTQMLCLATIFMVSILWPLLIHYHKTKGKIIWGKTIQIFSERMVLTLSFYDQVFFLLAAFIRWS